MAVSGSIYQLKQRVVKLLLIGGLLPVWLCLGIPGLPAQSPPPNPAAPAPPDAKPSLQANSINLQEALNAGSPDLFSRMFGQELFANKIMQGIDTDGNFSGELSQILARAVGSGIVFIQWSPGNRFEYLGEKQIDGQTGLFFRCLMANGTLNYFTFFTGYSAEADTEMVEDIYNHRTAQYRSIMAQQALVVASSQNQLLKPSQMSGMPISFSDYQKLALMAGNLRQGQLQKVRQVYQQLSGSTRQRPMAVMLYLVGCTTDDALWQQGKDLAQQLIPQALGPDLMIADRLTSRNQWRQSIALYESMLPRTNSDPYLIFRMARALYELEAYADAGKTALQALQKEPDMVDPYMLLMEIELKRQNYDGAFRLLKLLGDRFNVLVDSQQFEEDPAYQGFRESDAYAQWLTYRKARAAQLEQSPGP